jgi:mono/diheme cytochrome c family protein
VRRPFLLSLSLALPLALGFTLASCERPPPATRAIPPLARETVRGWLGGATPGGAPAGARPHDDRGFRALGAEVYRLRCIPCHGVNGNGKGIHAARLLVPARDFTKGVFEIRSTPTGSLPTDEDLFRSISRGMHGSAMIPWSWLPEEERWAVLAHVKGFSPRFLEEGPGEPLASGARWPGGRTAAPGATARRAKGTARPPPRSGATAASPFARSPSPAADSCAEARCATSG